MKDFVWHNDYAGDVSALADMVDSPSLRDNWFEGIIRGTEPPLTLSVKVFEEESTYGIGNGRISKMAVYNDALRYEKGFHGACEMHYDRGWDIRPRTREAYDRCKAVIEALGGHMNIRFRAPRKKPVETAAENTTTVSV